MMCEYYQKAKTYYVFPHAHSPCTNVPLPPRYLTIGGITIPRLYKIMFFVCLIMPPVVTWLLSLQMWRRQGAYRYTPKYQPPCTSCAPGSSTPSLYSKSTASRRLITYFLVPSSTSKQSPHFFYVPETNIMYLTHCC